MPAAQRRAACLQQKRAFNLPTLCLLPLPSTYLTEDTRPIRPAVDAGTPSSTASTPCPSLQSARFGLTPSSVHPANQPTPFESGRLVDLPGE